MSTQKASVENIHAPKILTNASIPVEQPLTTTVVLGQGIVFLGLSVLLFMRSGWEFGLPAAVIFLAVSGLLLLFRQNFSGTPAITFVLLSFISFLTLILLSGAGQSPFLIWVFAAPLAALFITRNSIFLLMLVLTSFAIVLIFLGNAFLSSWTTLIQLEHIPHLAHLASFVFVTYWMAITYMRTASPTPVLETTLQGTGIPGKNGSTSDLESQNHKLVQEVKELHNRNARLVKLYDNLKKFEIASEQKTEILAEAARILDIKNKQIRAVRDDYMHQSKTLEEVHEDLTNSIRYAQKIQEAITPEADWVVDHFKDAFIFYQPKDIVSGDFYWFEEIKTVEGRIKLLIAADCTGHGVPGAFMTVIGHSLINEIVHEMRITQPDVLLKELDRKIIEMLSSRNGKSEIHDGMDMVALMIDEGNQRLQYAAAHNPLFHIRKQEMKVIKGSRYPVGSSQYRTEKVFKLHTIDLEPNDAFYIFTDGFQDQFGEKAERKYMTRRFRNTILSINRLPMTEQGRKLNSEFDSWKGKNPQTDDVLVIGFRI